MISGELNKSDMHDHELFYKSHYDLDQPIDRRRRAGWIVSFTDLMAILLSFFVLMFSMAVPSTENWAAISSSFHEQFQRLDSQLEGYAGPSAAKNVTLSRSEDGASLDYVHTVLDGVLSRLPVEISSQVQILQRNDRIVIFAPALFAYKSGETQLDDSGVSFAARLAPMLKAFGNQILIVGHAAQSENGSLAQLLSLDRAVKMAELLRLKNLGHMPQVLALGADQQYTDSAVLQNDTQALLQRVDIVILKERHE